MFSKKKAVYAPQPSKPSGSCSQSNGKSSRKCTFRTDLGKEKGRLFLKKQNFLEMKTKDITENQEFGAKILNKSGI